MTTAEASTNPVDEGRMIHAAQIEEIALHGSCLDPQNVPRTMRSKFPDLREDLHQKYLAIDTLTQLVGDESTKIIIGALAETSYGAKSGPYGDFRIFSETASRAGLLITREANETTKQTLGDKWLSAFDPINVYATSWVLLRRAVVLSRNPDASAVAAVAYMQKGMPYGLTDDDFDHAVATWSNWKKREIQPERVRLYAALISDHGPMIAQAIEDRWSEIHRAIRSLRNNPGFNLDSFLVEKVGRIMGGIPRDFQNEEDKALETFIHNSVGLRQLVKSGGRLLSHWIEYNLVRAKQMDERTLDVEALEARTELVFAEATY